MKNSYLSPQDIAICISNLIARNKLWANKKVQLFFIVNSKAGCFNSKSISKSYYRLFEENNNEILKSHPCAISVSYKLFNTEYQGHATELTKKIISDLIIENNSETEYIVLSVGGDGTSLEVQTALYETTARYEKDYKDLMDRLSILRLPLGTGNDGTDGSYIEETFNLLKSGIIYSNTKVLIAYTKHKPSIDKIRNAGQFISKFCKIKSQSPWYSFNIASIGLDAFVTFVTNLVKSKFPGNLYHLCVPLSGLFYGNVFESGNIKIEMYKDNQEKPFNIYTGDIMLTAMGVSGNRTYGGGQKVLPNFNNLCVTPRVTLARLIKDNKKFVEGTHAGTDIGLMFSADKIKIFYDKPMMLQCDGECYLLCKEHFPLIIEKRTPCYKIIKKI